MITFLREIHHTNTSNFGIRSIGNLNLFDDDDDDDKDDDDNQTSQPVKVDKGTSTEEIVPFCSDAIQYNSTVPMCYQS